MKTVVLGAGRMGRRHIQVVKELSLDLVGICDSTPDALALAEKEQGVRFDLHYSDVSSLLDETRPECVIIATTAPTHQEYTRLAAQSGAKYILCEKPMAVSLAECDQMLEACRQYGAHLAINHQMRFMEQYTEPKRIINSEAFGGLASITVVAGNFGMAMNGTHYFEMLRYMADEGPEEITAWFSSDRVPNPRGPQFEDRAGSVRMTTPGGKRFYMEIGSNQGHGIQVIYAGKYGQIVVDELSGAMTMVAREEEHRSLPTTRYGMPAVYSSQAIQPTDALTPSRSVLDALLNDNNPPSGEDGRLALQALVAAYLSDEQNHRPVKLAETASCLERAFPWA